MFEKRAIIYPKIQYTYEGLNPSVENPNDITVLYFKLEVTHCAGTS